MNRDQITLVVRERISSLLAEEGRAATFDGSSSLMSDPSGTSSIGLDSIQLVDLTLAIESHFNCELLGEHLDDLVTVDDLVSRIVALVASKAPGGLE